MLPKLSPIALTPELAAGVSPPAPVRAVPAPASPTHRNRQPRSPARHAGIPVAPDRATSPARPHTPFASDMAGSPRASGAPPSCPTTPVKATGMPQLDAIANRASTRFLVDRLQSPALAQLVVHLHRELPSAWAFTGSVAMNIHAADLDGRKIRDFADADVQIDEDAFAAFERRQAVPFGDSLLTPPAAAGSGDAHYRFNGLAIDLVKNKRGTYPALSAQETIAGIPVLTLAALRHRKAADCDHGFDFARAAKARRDVPLLDDLISRRQAAQAGRTAVAENSGATDQDTKRKREIGM